MQDNSDKKKPKADGDKNRRVLNEGTVRKSFQPATRPGIQGSTPPKNPAGVPKKPK